MDLVKAAVAVLGVVLVVACGGTGASVEERFSQIIQDEYSYLEALEADTEEEESAIERYRISLNIFALGAEQSSNLEWDVCQSGILIERQKIDELRADPEFAKLPLWDRHSDLLDEVEELLCRDYESLTQVGDRYIGPLGDFRVNEGSVLDGKPCSGGIGEMGPFPSDHRESELWLGAFSESAVPDFCSDDDRLNAIFEYTDTAIIKRGFFYQAPLAAHFNALGGPPELLSIDARPAVLGEEASPSEQVVVWAIERFPEDDAPGVYIFVMGFSLDAEMVQEIARDLLR